MPTVEGLRLENARLMLRNAGFVAERVQIRYEEAYKPEDDVIRQSPAGGALIGVDTPIELVVSRRSLLHFLPQVYQKQLQNGGHFLREFLWVFDHIYADLQRKIDGIHHYFDPLEAPERFLSWLAGWVALTIDQEWPEAKKRKLIQQAISIYGSRGTVRGMKLFLSIFTGVEPKVMENRWPYRGFRVGRARIGVDSIVLPPVNLAYCFMVEVPAQFADASDEMILKIHDIIRMEKPSHAAYYLTFAVTETKEQLQPFLIGLGRVGIGEAGVVAGMHSRPEVEED